MEIVRILMVDDEPDDRTLFGRMLRRSADWEVDFREAANGMDAEALLRTGGDLDVVLLDLKLPGDSGLQLLQHWSENFPHLPAVILLTGHGGERVAVEAMKHGAFDYLSKHDCTPEELAHAVQHAALMTRLRRELGPLKFDGAPAAAAEASAAQFQSGEVAGVRRAVSTFLHEINSPLTGITNYVRLLLDEKGLPQHIRAILIEMLDASRRIERVMHSMESLEELRARPGSGRRSLLELGSSASPL